MTDHGGTRSRPATISGTAPGPSRRGDLVRVTAFAAVLGPALFLADNLLHPRELAPGNEAEQLRIIGAASDRWHIAHLLAGGTLFVGVVFVLGLGLLVRTAGSTAAAVGIALALFGVVANAFLLALDGLAWGTLGDLSTDPASDPATLAAALAAVQGSGWEVPYQAAAGLLPAGMVLLLVRAGRARTVNRPAAATMSAAMVLLALETLVHSNAFFVLSATVYLVAGTLVAWSLTRGAR